jgi:uncharacterized protein DUF6056
MRNTAGIPASTNEHLRTSGSVMFKRAARLNDSLLAASFVLSLIGYGYLGSFSRYMADDYSAVTMVGRHGLLGAQIASYQGWTGRFSFTFVADFLALIGPSTARIVPALLLTLLFAGAIWSSYQIHSLFGKVSWARVVLFPALVIFATLEMAPNVSQSLYWQTGALTYFAPLILLSLFVGVVARGIRRNQRRLSYGFTLACAAILPFIAGGFSDVYVVLQSCGLILSILAVEFAAGVDFKSRITPVLIAGLVGSFVALTIVALAPGNSVRLTYFPNQLPVSDILRLTARYSIGFIARQVLTHPATSLISLTLPLLIVLRDFNDEHRCNRRLCIGVLLITPPAVLLVIMCCVAPGVYAMSTMLPERARILLALTFVGGSAIWSRAAGEYLGGKLLRSSLKMRHSIPLAATLAIMLVILCSPVSLISVISMRDEARSFAADWDKQDSELKFAKQNGVVDVAVQQIGDFQSPRPLNS